MRITDRGMKYCHCLDRNISAGRSCKHSRLPASCLLGRPKTGVLVLKQIAHTNPQIETCPCVGGSQQKRHRERRGKRLPIYKPLPVWWGSGNPHYSDVCYMEPRWPKHSQRDSTSHDRKGPQLNDKIAANYRKAIGSIVWHHYTTCMSWPTHNFIGSKNPGGEEICSQCMALHALREKTCPLIVFEKPCGLQLTPHPDGLYYCDLGHRIRIVEID